MSTIQSGHYRSLPEPGRAVRPDAYVLTKPQAIILDFFSGSGTTAHAVMRLNRQDGGDAC
ncbi:DNA methyltransferase [Haematobacter massiliensis]|uniref:DNA methyltransferase n=1 Tax=Haematobacter massiliensis TaxID=195105 RepID=UPI003C6DA5DE